MSRGRRLAHVLLLNGSRPHKLGPAAQFPRLLLHSSVSHRPRWQSSDSRRAQAQAQTHGQTSAEGDHSQSQARAGQGKKPSLFEELFPGTTSPVRRQEGVVANSEGDLADDEVRRWLDADTEQDTARAGAATGDRRSWATVQQPQQHQQPRPTLLILAGASPSLLPSDFFRIAPQPAVDGQRQGSASSAVSASASASAPAPTHAQQQQQQQQHRRLDGWAAAGGGLYKVVQDRDPATLAPRGRYVLYFASPAAALSYAQEVRDLHRLAGRAALAQQGRQDDNDAFATGRNGQGQGRGGRGGRGRRSRSAAATPTEEEAAALHSFSLLAPTATLDLALQMPGDSSTSASTSHGRRSPYENMYDTSDAIDSRTKVLAVLENADPSSSDSSRGGGGGGAGATIPSIRRFLAADGVARNLPWPVSDGLNGVVPVSWIVAEQKRLLDSSKDGSTNNSTGRRISRRLVSGLPDLMAKTDHMNEQALYSRFVLTFSDLVEARRFVRSWHRRVAVLPDVDLSDGTAAARTAVLDLTVLW